METSTPTPSFTQVFFRVCLVIDAILVFFLLADALSSGSGFDLVVQVGFLPGLGWYLRERHPKWAAFLAAIPAVLIVSFITYLAVVLSSGNLHWQ
ncbi:MAG: hypothetical protein ICV83_08690 [Cytophagales bacterium]|nr:hypothetical protein [Cytophagales bacterium]